jgi:hypothetical protein
MMAPTKMPGMEMPGMEKATLVATGISEVRNAW